MLSLYSNWWIKPGKEEEAKKQLKLLAATVQAKEPNTLMYLVHFPTSEFYGKFKSVPATRPGAVTFVERYANWEAFDAHVSGDIFQNFLTDHGHLFVQDYPKQGEDSQPFIQVVFMDEVAGFIRE